MKKLIAGGAAVLLALGLSATVVAPAQAWYHRGYGYGYGPAVGLGLLGGIIAGAAIANAASNDRGHVDACYNAYKSYDRRSDTYLGYDGYRHRCML
jgi:hypothetical protein